MAKIKRNKLKYNKEQFLIIMESCESKIREIIVDYVDENDSPKFHKVIKTKRLINLYDIIAQLRHKHVKEDSVVASFNAINESRFIFERRIKIKNKTK